MANNSPYVNTDKVALESARLLVNKLLFVKMINNSYEKYFNGSESIGSNVRVRVPWQPQVSDGSTLVIQDFVEQFRDLPIDKQKHIGFEFTTKERSLDVKDYSNRVLRPKVPALAASTEQDIMNRLINGCSNVVTNSAISQNELRVARARLTSNLMPDSLKPYLFVNPTDNYKILEGSQTLFNAQGEISNQYTENKLTRVAGFDVYESTLIPKFVTGNNSARACTISVNVLEGATSMILTGLDATGTVKRGEIFTVSGVLDVNYQTKDVYVNELQFVVLADATAVAGVVTVSTHALYEGGGTENSASTDSLQTVSQLPIATDVVTFLGAANSSYEQSFAFHPDFATTAFLDPDIPKGMNNAGKYHEDGIGMSYKEDYTITTDKFPARCDVYYGSTWLWQTWGVRIVEI